MEAEEAEATKRYKHPLSLGNFLLPVAVAVVLLGYWSLPTIVDLVQVVTVWFDWFCLVIRNIFFVLVFVNALIVLIYFSFHKTAEKNKPDLFDQYFAAVPSAVRPSPDNYFRDREAENYDNGYYNNKNYEEIVPAFEAVKECNCYDRVVMEEQRDSKSYRRRTRSEKKASTVEYRSTESERATKTSSWRSETMDVLSSEEFRMTVETFITERKKMLLHQNGDFDQRQNGFVDQWQNAVANQWLNGVPKWQNDVVQRQGSPDDGTGRQRRRRRSRNHSLVGGSGSIGSGSYLSISN